MPWHIAIKVAVFINKYINTHTYSSETAEPRTAALLQRQKNGKEDSQLIRLKNIRKSKGKMEKVDKKARGKHNSEICRLKLLI